MNVNSIITRIYEDNSRFWFEKNKAKSKPIAGPWPEILSTKLEILNDLKKQSQFVMAQLNISISDIRCYGVLNEKRRRKNKANQSQSENPARSNGSIPRTPAPPKATIASGCTCLWWAPAYCLSRRRMAACTLEPAKLLTQELSSPEPCLITS